MNGAQTNPERGERSVESRASVTALLAEARRARQHSYLRWPELVGLGASTLMILAVAFAYFYYLLPARSRITQLQVERSDLQRKIRESEAGAKRQTDAQATVTEISESLRNFESSYLPQRSAARTEIVQELSNLIAENKLQLTAPMTFAGSDNTEGVNPEKVRKAFDEKDQLVFPSINVSLSVEGSYANLRHLVRDIEASKQFMAIRSVELQQGAGASRSSHVIQEANSNQKNTSANAPVTLALKLGAYFQREANASTQVTNQQTAK